MPPRDFLSQLGASLNGRQTREADIFTHYRVVRPLDPRGLTVVRSQCNEQELVVGNVSGLTFAPGASVMVGTNTGRPGKAIIAGAPPGRMGTSFVPQDYRTRTYGSAPEEPSACPVSRTGRSYLGIYVDDGSDTLYAYNYTDGEYVSTASAVSFAGLDLEADPHFQRAHTIGDTVIFYASTGGTWQICTWDTGADTLVYVDVDPAAFAGPIVVGSDVYFASWDSPFLQLYKVAVGDTGTWDEPTARVGAAYEDTSGFLFVPDNLCHSGGVTFQSPAFWFDTSTEVRVPYYSGGWNLGAGRAVLAGSDDPGTGNDGYAISGSRSLRITYTMPGFVPVLGVMPAGPGTPEVSLLPSDWSLNVLANLSVSPSGAEFCVFLDSGVALDKIVRLGVNDDFSVTGCALPQITVEPGPEGLPSYMLCRDN